MIFSRGKVRNLPDFIYNGSKLEIVFSYPYLGILMNYNGRFSVAQKDVYDKASRAMFGLLAKCRKLRLPFDIQIKLFDSVVKPIALYGSEVWGPYYTDVADKLQLKFIKLALGLKTQTPSVMVRGETGSFPVLCDIKMRVLNFWFKLVNDDKNKKISCIMYKCMYSMFLNNSYICPWILYVKKTLDELGMSDIFITQAKNIKFSWFKSAIKLRIEDCYRQEWSKLVYENEQCTVYRIFKNEFGFESYLTNLSHSYAIGMLKFRTRNVMIPLVRYRFENLVLDHKCYFCNNESADEFHYIMECQHFNNERFKLKPKVFFTKHVNILKFKELMCSDNVLYKLAVFIKTMSLVLNAYSN